MELRRRFIFHGNAAAIGGRIVRPADVMLDSVSSSLTVVGGRTKAQAGPTRFGEWISFESAATFAEGVFDDLKQQIEFSYHRVAQDTLTMTTRVRADVTGLSVDEKPNLKIKRVHAAMTARSPEAGGEPAIAIDKETTIEGATIDGYGLEVELAVSDYQRYDTRADGTIYATIARSIRWSGEPFPGATIENHVVTVPDFGKIFFGELLVTDRSQRLTMVRMELGSPTGGEVAVAEVDSNGTWST